MVMNDVTVITEWQWTVKWEKILSAMNMMHTNVLHHLKSTRPCADFIK